MCLRKSRCLNTYKTKIFSFFILEEASEFNTTLFVYVGELADISQIKSPMNLKKIIQLEQWLVMDCVPDLWDAFRNRFNVEMICEIYGASEGNALFMNLLNKEKTIGMTNVDVELIKYDVAEDSIFKDSITNIKKLNLKTRFINK